MQRDVQDWCQTHEICATRKSAPKRNRVPLKKVAVEYPMQVVDVDILGHLLEHSGKLLLVGFWRLLQEMEAKKLIDKMFCRFSVSEQLHSDQGW